MKNMLIRAALTLMLVLVCRNGVFAQDTQPELTTISVTVADSQTKKPLSGVEVLFQTPGGTTPPGGKTDAQGRLVQTGFSPGIYYVETIRLVGYERPIVYGPINIKGGETIEVPTIWIRPTGTIEGTVLDASGKPIRSARIEALSYGALGNKRALRVQRTAFTDAGGRFHIADVDPIGILVRASVAAARPSAERFVTTYYPNAATTEDAKLVRVPVGGSVKGIDFRLALSPTFNIRGRVAQGMESLEYSVLSFQPCSNPDLRDTPTSLDTITLSADNSFEIPEVLPGTYCFLFKYIDSSVGAIRTFAEQTVKVVDRDINDVVLSPVPMEDVFVAVTSDSGQPVPLPRSVALDYGAMGQLPLIGGRRTASGFYLPGVAPSGYQFLVYPSQGSYVKSIRRGYKDFNDGEIRFGQDYGIIVIEMGVAANRLKIRVNGNDNPPWKGIFVRADPVGAKHRFDKAYIGYTNASSEVEFSGLAPGTYRISAWSKFEAVTMDRPEFKQRFTATTIEVGNGDESTVDVNLITADKIDEARASI